ncbi:MAG: T9SS type A sorting domain-containing protein [Flavobacteriales bacterium]
MKFKTILLLVSFPMFSIGQWSLDWDGDDLKMASIGEDVEFDMSLDNPTSQTLSLKWRILDNSFPAVQWEDFFCAEVCYSSAVRAKELTIDPNTNYPLIHHISIKEVGGYGTSKICFFDPSDSAGTLQCLVARVATDPSEISDTIWVSSNGTNFGIVKGKVYVLQGSNYIEYPNYSNLVAGDSKFIVIDGDLYWFKTGKYVLYTETEELSTAQGTFYLIEGYAFTFDGVTTYTLVGEAKKVKVEGADVYVINGDSFELFNGTWVPLSVNEVLTSSQNSLAQNSPNPFKYSTSVTYSLSGSGRGSLIVYDLTGKTVESHTLNSNAGQVMIGQGLSEGVYFYSLWTEDGQVLDTSG